MTNRKVKILFLLSLSLIVLINTTRAQNPADDEAPIKVNTFLLNIPVTVTDKTGHNVTGLKKEDFSVYQDGEKQEIAFFVSDEAPMNVAILLDTSFSTRPVLDDIQKAAKDFLKVFRPEDKGVIVTFDYQTLFLTELVSDQKTLTKAINNLTIADRPGSEMHDAIYQVVKNYFAEVKGRKAIIVLTDGAVGGRFISNQQILKLLQLSDTLFYPIVFKTRNTFSPPSKGAKGGKFDFFEPLKRLAEETAGKFYEEDATNLKTAFQSIAEELKQQYLIGYYPSANGKPDNVKIVVDRKDVTIQAKRKLKFNQAN
jgi:Ca-activated chloride channel family protein